MTLVSACGGNENGNGQNPLLGEWTTPYGVPPFDQIKTSDYLPAFKEAMKQHNEEIEAIVSSKETPTFENTILAYDNAGDLLGRIASTFWSVAAADTDPEMQKVQHETGKVLNIGVVNRFNAGVNLIKKYIDSGKLGEVYHVYVSFRAHRSIPGLGGAFTTKVISGGGVLVDWGVHYLDIVMYCCGDPKPLTVSGETFTKLGVDIKNYAFEGMWAGPPKYDGIYDVDDSVAGIIRTEKPVITINGAWAQNIGENETFIDFMGDKAGIRLQYGSDFRVFTSEFGSLIEYKPKFKENDMFRNEIDSFLRCIKTGEKLPSHIDNVAITAKMMQAIYDSAASHREIVF